MDIQLETMYPGIAYSPATTLTQPINEAATTLYVADASAFPPAPNLATIGTDEMGETILYAAKGEGVLSGCTRGVQGSAKAWQQGEAIARNFTELDYQRLMGNISALAEPLRGATAQPTAGTLACRDASGRLQVGEPAANEDAARLADLRRIQARRLALNLPATAWTGTGPYSVAITQDGVTAQTAVELVLDAAAEAHMLADITVDTTAGSMTWTTAVRPTGALTGTVILYETEAVTG